MNTPSGFGAPLELFPRPARQLRFGPQLSIEARFILSPDGEVSRDCVFHLDEGTGLSDEEPRYALDPVSPDLDLAGLPRTASAALERALAVTLANCEVWAARILAGLIPDLTQSGATPGTLCALFEFRLRRPDFARSGMLFAITGAGSLLLRQWDEDWQGPHSLAGHWHPTLPPAWRATLLEEIDVRYETEMLNFVHSARQVLLDALAS